ncbi:MAG: hypothetical protein E2O38_08405 [Proteobacteria bacterium]|nr:MAG: hypothetical protein E2O38_08405 [Pseudomonadota bacterium]
MKRAISIGQIYHDKGGAEYAVVKVSKDRVIFEDGDGDIVHMDLDEFASDLQQGVLVYQYTEE